MIGSDDAGLRALFAAESEDALGQLGELALALEQPGDHEEHIATMFRAAHSLKGSARLVGLSELGDVAHALEDVLSRLRAGSLASSAEVVTLILRATDLLRDLLPGALAGDDQRAAISAAITEIGSAASACRHAAPAVVAPRAPASADPDPPPLVDAAAAPAPAGPRGEPVEMIRVPAERLDAIGRLVGEAHATQVGLVRLVAERAEDDPLRISLQALERILDALEQEARRARMVSFRDVVGPLQRAARDVARSSGKEIDWTIEGTETQLDRHVLERLRDPLLHLVRNAVDHGLEAPEERAAAGKPPAGQVSVRADTRGDEVLVTVSDDGRGVDQKAVADAARRAGLSSDSDQAIFAPGVSTAARVTEVSGRGVGLDVVQDTVERLRGRVSMHSETGAGTVFELRVPLSLASLRCLIVGVGEERYALPLPACVSILDDLASRITRVEGRRALALDGALVPVEDLGDLLHGNFGPAQGPAVIVRQARRTRALRVDRLEGQRDVVVKELSRHTEPIAAIAGATVEADGTVTLVLDPSGLLDLAERSIGSMPAVDRITAPVPRTPEVLVVDDALTVRELQRSILRRAGFAVRTAVDGRDAISALGAGRPDLVISDVEMPHMDGFELTESIRRHPSLANLPVILITSLGDDAHRRRGLDAGADAYLVKDTFDEASLLRAINQVLGEVT